MSSTISDDIGLLDYLIQKAEVRAAEALDERKNCTELNGLHNCSSEARLQSRIRVLLMKYREILVDDSFKLAEKR